MERLSDRDPEQRSDQRGHSHGDGAPESHAGGASKAITSGTTAPTAKFIAETRDADAKARAAEIEANLKRLILLSERLLQLARVEGGRLRSDHDADLRPAARLIVDDLVHSAGSARIRLLLPEAAVISDFEPDAFAINLCNLIEKALRHGTATGPDDVSLTADGTLSVANQGAAVPVDDLSRLTQRFERMARLATAGSGHRGIHGGKDRQQFRDSVTQSLGALGL